MDLSPVARDLVAYSRNKGATKVMTVAQCNSLSYVFTQLESVQLSEIPVRLISKHDPVFYNTILPFELLIATSRYHPSPPFWVEISGLFGLWLTT